MRLEDFLPQAIPGRQSPIIAIVGCDGSGKSTVSSALLKFMRKKCPTALCHLGKQAGNLERSVAPLPIIGSLVTQKARKENTRIQSGQTASGIAAVSGFILSMRRVVRFICMRRRHAEGVAILTDRYPQNEVPGPMDGPTLANLKRDGVFFRFFRMVERSIYARMEAFQPDLVIRLNVDLETALKRKPDHVPFKLERKIQDLKKIHFNGAPILDLSAQDPLKKVLKESRLAVEKVLSAYQTRPKGILISLVGCDGSGKSSISQDLVKQFGAYRPATYGYLGLGSGDLGRRIGAWPIIGGLLEKKLTNKAKKTRTKGEKIPGVITALVVFIFSLIRLKRFKRVRKAVEQGYLVITDRYPQAEVPGQCDGAGLSAACTNNPFIRLLARWEKHIYQTISEFKPDLVVRLDVDAETAHQRKPDHDIEALRIKTEIMPRLTFNNALLVAVDARPSYEDVRQKVVQILQHHHFV